MRKLADFIVNKVNDIQKLTGRSPNSLAAAAIYLAAEQTGNRRSAEEIGKTLQKIEQHLTCKLYFSFQTKNTKGRTCGAAENTIKQTFKVMIQHKDKILPPDFKASSSSKATASSENK